MAGKTCPYCSGQLPEGARFCNSCGREVAGRTCPTCGAKVVEGSRFCHLCGTTLSQPEKPPPAAPLACPKCGKDIPPAHKFCRFCGAPRSPASLPGAGAPSAPPPPTRPPAPETLVPPPVPAVPAAPVIAPEPEAVKAAPVTPVKDAAREEKDRARLRRMSRLSTYLGISLAVIAVVLVIGYAVTGLLGNQPGKDGTTPATPAPVTTTPPATPVPTTRTATPAPTPTPTKSLADILGLAANVSSLRYDASLSGSGTQPMVYKVWLKKNKMRWEITQQGMNAVVLMDLDAKTMYTYLPAQNLAMKMPFDPLQAPDDPLADTRSMQGANARVTGIETLDGKVCTVVQYVSGQENVKGWIWTEKGLPVRIETATGAGKTTVDYRNYDFSDLPDSLFTLPAGVKVM